MDYMYHDEDDLPVISLSNISPFTRRIPNDNHDQDSIENDYSSRLIGNWQNLYQTSIHSLQRDDEDRKPFHLNRQPSFENPRREITSSPLYQEPFDSNMSTFKWKIRLPELLNGTVGPDRQKRDSRRRHTTNIVFQRSNSQNTFAPYSPNGNEDVRPISPIVQQLKQKFNQMTANTTPPASPRIPQRFPSNIPPRLYRSASVISRGPNANIGRPLVRQPRAALPVRPSAEITTVRSRTTSIGSINNRTPMGNGRTQREKGNPPVSYPRHFYPPPSTTSVVKQLIGGGATLVYDSIARQNAPKTNYSVSKHQRTIEQRTKDLETTKSDLTGRHRPSDSSSAGYATVKDRNNNNYGPIKSKDNDSEIIYDEPLSRKTSNDSSEGKYIPARTEPWNNHINTNEYESENYYAVYE